jgi:peptide/nickel transport system permease protein
MSTASRREPLKPTEAEGLADMEIAETSKFKRWRRLLLRSKTGTIGFIIVTLVCLVAIFADLLAPHNPAQNNPVDMLTPPVWQEGGTSEYILGTDQYGRDMLSRILKGSQVSLLVGLSAVVIAGIIGIFLGLIAGFYGGLLDNFIMRLVDAFLSIPNVLLILVMLTIFDPGLLTLIIVLGATNWVMYARMVRGEVLSVKEREFVIAAKASGTRKGKVMFKHIFPNVISSCIVISTLSVAGLIITEAALSFLGLGIQPPMISWGGMLSIGRDFLATSWWLATFPGIAISITVLGIIFLGDWLRDVLDPRSK